MTSLYRQGLSVDEVGRELGVASITVSRRLRKAGVDLRCRGRKRVLLSDDEILRLRGERMTWQEVADRVGMTINGVHARWRKMRDACGLVDPMPAAAPRSGVRRPDYPAWCRLHADNYRPAYRFPFEIAPRSSDPNPASAAAVTFGALFLASYMALSDDHPPTPSLDDPVGTVFCLLALTLTIRSLRLAVVVRADSVAIRGYFTTRKLRIDEIDSLSVIDYPGPWWLSSDRLKGLRVNRNEGRRGLTVWGVTGSEKRVKRARTQIEAALPALETGSRWSG